MNVTTIKKHIKSAKLMDRIAVLVRRYAELTKTKLPKNKVPISGKVFDEDELINGVNAVLDGWWTEGKYCAEFENALKNYIGTKFALTTNSGSSANLIAFYALTSTKLGKRKIKKGDHVITAAAAFPTTVNPIIQFGAVPVFLDVELGAYNVRAHDIENAITEKTKAIFVAHTLGNPFEAKEIREIADEHKLWLIEDSCDALGSKYAKKMCGTFGHVSSLSFYPAHHITTAEGGAVLTDNPLLYKIMRSFRDWGRDCWCPTGTDNTCKKRFSWKLGKLPYGYDHKYIYSEIGFNLKMTDIQAAIGIAQIKKLPKFMKKRRDNFSYLLKRFTEEGLERYFIMPDKTKNSEPCWFGFPLTIKKISKKNINRTKLLENLDKRGIATRLVFAGNITKQPYFINNNISYRVAGNLKNTDVIMERTFWIGIFPALNKRNLEYVVKNIKDLIAYPV
ncbi:MAG: lipopolysaccharide biosynthesis protein RfbH [Candidatus Micrarchaeota archaeon]